MGATRRRPLTQGEKEFVREAFGDRIDFARVGLSFGAGRNPAAAVALRFADAVTLIRTIYFRGKPVEDFAQAGDKLLLLHEMTHIWQYQKLGALRFYLRYGKELAKRRLNRHAMYEYDAGEPFDGAMLEAQADMVRDYARGGLARAKAAASLADTGLYGR